MNGLRDRLILWGLGLGWDHGCHNGMLREWEDHVVEARSLIGGNNNRTWVEWRKLKWSFIVFRTSPRGGVGRINGVVAIFSLLTSLVVYRVWLKGTSTKVWEERGSITFSFNFSFPLEAIFYLPPSTCVYAKLARASMQMGLIFFLKGISKVGVLSFE